MAKAKDLCWELSRRSDYVGGNHKNLIEEINSFRDVVAGNIITNTTGINVNLRFGPSERIRLIFGGRNTRSARVQVTNFLKALDRNVEKYLPRIYTQYQSDNPLLNY